MAIKKDTFTAAVEPNYTADEGTTINVINKENRPVEVVINRVNRRWEPYEKKSLTADEVATEDFKSAEKYFTVVRG